jgi:hypothetical protein
MPPAPHYPETMSLEVDFRASVWRYEGAGAWHFVTLPRQTAERVLAAGEARGRPWGAVRVSARIGRTRWQTSLFRDRKRESYLLPIKSAVRLQEQLRPGEEIDVFLRLEPAP